MKVIPAVDILGGKCVQLVGGDPKTAKTYGDPVDAALGWIKKGGRILHLVDLDAALGTGENHAIIKSIRAKTSATVFVGGGIRSIEKVGDLVSLGIDKIILGTAALEDIKKDFEFLKQVHALYGREKLIISVDSKKGKVVTKGWTEKTGIWTVDAVRLLEPHCWGILYTDVDVEGKMEGARMERAQEVIDSTRLPVVVSGGVSSKKDLDALKEAGAWGVIVGKALYEKKIKPNLLGEYR